MVERHRFRRVPFLPAAVRFEADERVREEKGEFKGHS